MKPLASLLRATLALPIVVGLVGCAGVYRVDNQVESFARWTQATGPTGAPANAVPAPPQRYRFEQLPSQTSGPAAQSQAVLEQWTQTALAPLGWTLAESASQARWTVQVTAESTRLPQAPWEDPWDVGPFRWSGYLQIGSGGGGMMWNPWLVRHEFPYYQRQVSLVIRAVDNGRVVYETRAAHDGRWNSTPELWRAMLTAALTGFPASPPGARLVNIDVPR